VYQRNNKIYPHIYPLWGIAFACVIDYTDSLEVLLIGVTADQHHYLNIRRWQTVKKAEQW
jgi:hypothetical protein